MNDGANAESFALLNSDSSRTTVQDVQQDERFAEAGYRRKVGNYCTVLLIIDLCKVICYHHINALMHKAILTQSTSVLSVTCMLCIKTDQYYPTFLPFR